MIVKPSMYMSCLSIKLIHSESKWDPINENNKPIVNHTKYLRKFLNILLNFPSAGIKKKLYSCELK